MNVTTEVRRGHELNVQSLESYLVGHINGLKGPLSVRQFEHGQSNPTYYIKSPTHELVLRKKPAGKLLPTAHMVEREYQVLAALQQTPVPVPRVFFLCTDSAVLGTPFYVMEFVHGRIFKDPALPGMKAQERRAIYNAMATALAQLHSVDWRAIGLDGYGKPEKYVQRQISRWSDQYTKAETHKIADMDSLIKWLPANIPVDVDTYPSVIAHGDFRLDNLVFHPTQPRVVAILDWELATIGHPLSDASYVCLQYYMPPAKTPGQALSGLMGVDLAAAGIPTQEELLEQYLRMSGIGNCSITFYLALSFFRLASICQGVYKRHLDGNSTGKNAETMNVITEYLANSGMKIAMQCKKEGNWLRKQALPFGMASTKLNEYRNKLLRFMDEHIYPAEKEFIDEIESNTKAGKRWTPTEVVEKLKVEAKAQGLWNLWIPKMYGSMGPGLSNLEYASLCEIMGRSIIAPEVFNCSAPDTGNMEVIMRYGTEEQKEKWLKPLMEGEIRSCFGMTEPAVASSDATNIQSSIRRDGNEYIVNGRKWWTSGAGDPRCKVCIFMGKTTTEGSTHKQQSMIIVPMDAPGVHIIRPLSVFGYDDAPHGHMEVDFDNVRVPVSNILWAEGRGFDIAQGRLGPGRIHHCMRLIGLAERALETAVTRSTKRVAFKRPLAMHSGVMNSIAQSRIEVDQARLLCLHAAYMLDKLGNKFARKEIAMIKILAPNMAINVVDRAIQVHGGAGVSQDTPLAYMYAGARTLRIADGPDEVHLLNMAKEELREHTAKL